jgi:hypothetical protein
VLDNFCNVWNFSFLISVLINTYLGRNAVFQCKIMLKGYRRMKTEVVTWTYYLKFMLCSSLTVKSVESDGVDSPNMRLQDTSPLFCNPYWKYTLLNTFYTSHPPSLLSQLIVYSQKYRLVGLKYNFDFVVRNWGCLLDFNSRVAVCYPGIGNLKSRTVGLTPGKWY